MKFSFKVFLNVGKIKKKKKSCHKILLISNVKTEASQSDPPEGERLFSSALAARQSLDFDNYLSYTQVLLRCFVY